MQYRRLGATGLTVSVIGVGTWQLGGEWGKQFTQPEADAIFDAARDSGINLIDTAECYGDHESERLIGAAIARDRDRWVVATKFGHHFRGFMDRADDYSVATMRRQLEDSLRALRTDHIDIYQVHGITPATLRNDELWTELVKAREAGKIRHIGASVKWKPENVRRPELETVQVYYNRLEREAETTDLPVARERGLGVLARVPLASGLLSGRYRPGARWAADDVRATQDPKKIEAMLAEVQRIQAEEVPPGVPMAGWALAWVLRHPTVTATIPGAKSADQVRANAAAAELDINQIEHPQAAPAPTR